MIVRYVKECQGEKMDMDLTLGKEYLVLAIRLEREFYLGAEQREPYIGVQRESDGYPSLFNLKFFDIVDSRIPEGVGL